MACATASTLRVTVLAFRAQACKLGLEGAVSKRADRPYAPSDRGIWVKSKCLDREEFVVVGWTDPEGQPIGKSVPCYWATTPKTDACPTRAGGYRHDGQGTEAPGGVLAPLRVARMPVAQAPPRELGSSHRSSFPRSIGSART